MSDQYEGVGGSYVLENGVRKLVEKTQDKTGAPAQETAAEVTSEAVATTRTSSSKDAKAEEV